MRVWLLLLAALVVGACGSRREGAAPTEVEPDTIPVAKGVTAAPSPAARDAGAPSAIGPAAEPDAGASPAKTYASRVLGIRLEPGDFSATETSGPVLTRDGHFRVDQPHGLVPPGEDSKQYFRGRISIRKRSVRASVKEDSPSLDGVLYPKATFVAARELAEPRTIAGRSGFVVLTGAHGYDYRDYYVGLDDGRTLVARFSVVGDYVQSVKHGPSEKSQDEAIEKVVASLRLE